jgi:Ig-fold domain
VFDLLPGESRAIVFAPDNPADLARAKDTLVIRDLYSSSH